MYATSNNQIGNLDLKTEVNRLGNDLARCLHSSTICTKNMCFLLANIGTYRYL